MTDQIQQNLQNMKINLDEIKYETYKDESQLDPMMKMIEVELSEPYSIFTYRYFVNTWPELTFIAYHQQEMIGVIIGKLDFHKGSKKQRGYIAMIVVDKKYRGLQLGKKLGQIFIDAVKAKGGEEVVLETEVVNKGALSLYKSLGFSRVKRLMNYYLNGNDAFRLKLWLTPDREEDDQENQIENKNQEEQSKTIENSESQIKTNENQENQKIQ